MSASDSCSSDKLQPSPIFPNSIDEGYFFPSRGFPCDKSALVVFGLGEGVGDLLASVDRTDEHEEGATGDGQSQGAGLFVSFLICT